MLCVLLQCLSDLCGADGTLNNLKTQLNHFNVTAQRRKHTNILDFCHVGKFKSDQSIVYMFLYFIAMICPPGPPGIPGAQGHPGEIFLSPELSLSLSRFTFILLPLTEVRLLASFI